MSLRSIRFDPGWPGLTTAFSGHLWFLQALFLVSLLVLPALVLLRRASGRRLLAWAAGKCAGRGGVLLLAFPLVLVRIAFMSLLPAQHGWGDFLSFATLFLLGYAVAADDRFTASLKRSGWPALALFLPTLGGLAVLRFGLSYNVFDEPFSARYVLFQALMGLCTWSAIVLLMGAAARRLNRASRFLSYANEAVLPFYLFHQTVILGIGWFVIQWDMGILPKLLIVTLTSFIGTMILYDALVRHSAVMRFLFGMRPPGPSPTA